ncbi:MAG: hypothetical protein AABY04_02400 [Candidatus Micrarchaeota archaeon]
MAITPESQRKQISIAQPLSQKVITRQKIRENMDVLRTASGANSIQGFGRMTIGAIVLSVIFSLATLLAVLYGYFAERIPDIARYLYPLLAGLIIFLFYIAIYNIRDGFIMFEASKEQEDNALEEFAEKLLQN